MTSIIHQDNKGIIKQKQRKFGVEGFFEEYGVEGYKERMLVTKEAGSIFDTWGYGGTAEAKNAASPPLIDLDELGVSRCLWLPGTAGNYVSTPDINEIDYDSSTFESNTGKWEGLNKNLLTAQQSSAETDATGWSLGNCTVVRSTSQFAAGAASFAATAVGAGNVTIDNANNEVPIVVGQVYTMVASFKSGLTPRQVRIDYAWENDAGGRIGAYVTGPAFADNSAGWTQATAVAQAPVGATRLYMVIAVIGVAAGEVHYIDAIGLFETPNGNLIPNSDFKSGTTGWVVSGTGVTAAASTEQAYTGRQSVKMVGVSGVVGQFRDNNVKMLANKPYTASVWLNRTSGTSTARLTLAMANEAITGSADYTAATGTWQRVSVTITPNADTTGYIRVLTDGGPITVFIDAVQIVAGSAAVEYLPPMTANLIVNSSLEVDTSNWVGYNSIANTAAFERSTTRAYVGAASYLVTKTVAGAGSIGARNGTYAMAREGEVVTVSAYIYPLQAGSFAFIVRDNVAGDSSAQEGVAPNFTLVANAWQRISWTVKVKAARTVDMLYVVGSSMTSVGDSFHFDAVQMERGVVATPYVDGSLGPGYVWESSDNLISNPSFETNTLGWEGLNKNLLTANQSSLETDTTGWSAGSNMTRARSITQALVGSASMSMTATASGEMLTGMATIAEMPVVTPGQVYTTSAAFLAATVGRSVKVRISWYTESAPLNTVDGMPVADRTSGWQQAILVAQAPVNATRANVTVVVSGCAAGEVHYVDAIGLFETPNGNLVANPDFEDGVGDWSSSSSTIGHSTAQAHTGRACLAVTPSTAVANTASWRSYSSYVKMPVGTVATFSCYVFATAATVGAMNVQHDNAAGNTVLSREQGPDVVVPANTWTRLTCTATVPIGGGNDRVEPAVVVGSGVTYYVDSVQVVVGSAAFEYLPRATTNLIFNPSFEVNTNGWTVTAGVVRSIEQAYTGSASGKWTPSTVAFTDYTVDNLQVGMAYTLSAWLFIDSVTAAGRTLRMDFRTNTNSVAVNSAAISTYGTWQRVSVTWVATQSTILIGPRASDSGTYYIDGVQLEIGATATPYVDGSLGAGYVWEASENLLPAAASSFEDGTVGGWANNVNATLTNSSAQAFSGTKSLSVASTAAGESSVYYTSVPAAPGATYTVSAYVRAATTSRQMYFSIEWRDSVGVQIETRPTVYLTSITTGWIRLVIAAIAPPGTVNFRLRVGVADATMLAGETWYLDAVQVEQRPYATSYGQVGTAHVSTSRRETPWVSGGTWLENVVRASGPAANGTFFGVFKNDINIGAHRNNTRMGGRAGLATEVAVAPNTTYTLSNHTQGGSLYVRVTDMSAGGDLLNQNIPSATLATNRVASTFTTGATTTRIRIAFESRSFTDFIGDLVYVDAVQLEQRPYATPYGQISTAHASTSRRETPWILGGTWLESFMDRQATGGVNNGGRLRFNTTGRYNWWPWGYLSPLGFEYRANVAASTTYTFTPYLLYNGQVAMRVLDAATGAVLASRTTTRYTTFTRESLTFTTGSATTQVRLQILHTGVMTLMETTYVDSVQLEKATAASNYTLPLNITGDIDLRAYVVPEDWTPALPMALVDKMTTSSTNRSYLLVNTETNALRLYWFDGTTTQSVTSSVPMGLADGSSKYVRATLDVDNGASGRTARFYTSNDGLTWTQLGTDIIQAGITTISASTAPLVAGAHGGNTTWQMKGKVISAEVRAGINGTVVARYDSTVHTDPTYTDALGKVWSIVRSGDVTAEIVDRNCWAFTGTEYLTLPDRNELDVGDGYTVVARGFYRDIAAASLNVWDSGKRDTTAGTVGLITQQRADGTWLAQVGDGVTLVSRSTPYGAEGAWATVGVELTTGRLALFMAGLEATSGTHGLSIAALSSANDKRFGHPKFGAWMALFRRVLTAAEHVALAAWDGKTATEPAWLRGAAKLYINIDDKQSRLRYKAFNRVVNLATL